MQDQLIYSWEKKFGRYVVYSILLHIGVFLFFTIQNVLLKSPAIDVSAAVRVDLVALPDKVIDDKPAQPAQATRPTPTTVPAPTPTPKAPTVTTPATRPQAQQKKEEEAINLERRQRRQSDALKRLEQQEAIAKMEKALEEERKAKALQAAQQQYKGNVISPGSSLTGTQKFVQDNYMSEVDRVFRANWALPQYLRSRGLVAEINVKFDSQGNVIGTDVVKSSGNPTFDELAMNTVTKSSPVPPPPDQFAQVARVVGFIFRFRE